jgi:c-di-GMP-related signal transduction protein
MSRKTGLLVELADYITVDFAGPHRKCAAGCWTNCTQVHHDAGQGGQHQADYRKAREEGFTLFEGYFFCEPVAMRNRRPPVNQMLRLDILKALQQPLHGSAQGKPSW